MNKVVARTISINNKVFVAIYDGYKYWVGDKDFETLNDINNYIIKSLSKDLYNKW